MKRFRLTSGESIGAIVLVVCMALPVAMHLCSPRGHADAAAQAAADSAAQARIDSMQQRDDSPRTARQHRRDSLRAARTARKRTAKAHETPRADRNRLDEIISQ